MFRARYGVPPPRTEHDTRHHYPRSTMRVRRRQGSRGGSSERERARYDVGRGGIREWHHRPYTNSTRGWNSDCVFTLTLPITLQIYEKFLLTIGLLSSWEAYHRRGPTSSSSLRTTW